MIDDIVTRLRTALETDESILLTMPRPTVQMMADEIERLRLTLHELASHYSSQNAEQLRIVRAVEADRDHWRNIAQQAVDNADQAVKLLEKLTGMSHD